MPTPHVDEPTDQPQQLGKASGIDQLPRLGIDRLRAAAYHRISDDRMKDKAGVGRQKTDNSATADRMNCEIVKRYVDNDKSAYKGKHRPAFEQMLAEAEELGIQVVIAWHDDRLWRDVPEQQIVFAMFRDAGVHYIIVEGRTYNTGSADDEFISTIQAAVAQRESADKSRRIRRKHAELARQGRAANGGPRPFGYERDRVTVKADEAAEIRDAAKRMLAGESMQSILRDWNGRGVETTGKADRWRTTTLRRCMYSARIAGMREHKGEIVCEDAEWPAIIDRTTHERLRKLLDGNNRGKAGPRTYLLSSLLRCGKCGAVLRSRSKRNRERLYVCHSGAEHGDCGGISVMAKHVEGVVKEFVVHALSGGGLAAALKAAAGDDTQQQALTEQLVQDEESLRELSRDYHVEKLIGRAEFIDSRKALEERIKRTKTALSTRTNADVLAGLPSSEEGLRAAWDARTDLNDLTYGIEWRRALIDAVLDYVTIMPSKARGGNRFDASRVVPTWRV